MILKIFPVLPEAFSRSSEPGWWATLPSKQLTHSAPKGSGPGTKTTQGQWLTDSTFGDESAGKANLLKRIPHSDHMSLGNHNALHRFLGLLYHFPRSFPLWNGPGKKTTNQSIQQTYQESHLKSIMHLKWLLSYSKMHLDRDDLFCCFKIKIAVFIKRK